jgi:hypothetical protein
VPAALAVEEFGTAESHGRKKMFEIGCARSHGTERGRVRRPAAGYKQTHADDPTSQLEGKIRVVPMRDAIAGEVERWPK